MRKTLCATLVAVLAAATLAFAGQPGAGWIKKANLITQMQSHGYTGIVVSAVDGHWKGEAIKNGHIITFEAAPKTGKITKSQPKTAG